MKNKLTIFGGKNEKDGLAQTVFSDLYDTNHFMRYLTGPFSWYPEHISKC